MFWKKSSGKNSLTDEELAALFKSTADKEIIGELFKRYTHLVYGVCLKYLKDRDSSKDAVMQIFENLIKSLNQHEIHNFKSWLYTYCKNHCLMELRKRPFTVSFSDVEESEELFMENDDILHLKIKEQNLLDLEEALTQLNTDQRKCISLFYLEEKSYKEIAESTGYSLNEVKSHIQNAKRNLKNHLDNRNEEG